MTTFGRHRGFFLLSVTLLLAPLVAAPLASEVSAPFLVGNFNDQPEVPVLPPITGLAPVGDRVAVVVGDRLWLTDGTAAGTEELCPTRPEGELGGCPEIDQVVAAGAMGLLFKGDDRLWVTDGTPDGTVALTDPPVRFEPGVGLTPFLLDPDRGLFYFRAHHPLRGFELWVSDGTRAGTREVVDLAPGSRSSDPVLGALAGDRLVFSAQTVDHGREPWVSDGTAAGTVLLRDIGAGGSFPTDFRTVGDRVVFTAKDRSRGIELWVTDGTPEGTEPLPEVVPGAESPALTFASETARSGLLFFAHVGGDRSLWITDGTAAGTREVRKLDREPSSDLPFVELVVAGDRAFFGVRDEARGSEPWVSDGTRQGTGPLGDLCPGPCSSFPTAFRIFGSHVLFRADDGTTGHEPWVSDGTRQGTRSLTDLVPGPGSSDAGLLAGDDARVFFQALNEESAGREVWVSEAPFTSVTRLTDLGPGGALPLFHLPVLENAIPWEDDLLLVASDGEHGAALWRSDGTPGGTRPVHTLIEPADASSGPSGLSRVADAIFFATHGVPALDATLWRTGGTADTTAPLAEVDLGAGAPASTFQSLTPLEDRLVFLVVDDQGRLDLWASGGTPETTGPLAQDVDAFQPEGPLPTTGEAAFLLSAAFEPGLWVTDGTADGTRRLREIHLSDREAAAVFQGRLFFAGALPGTQGDDELWVSDGTPDGTVPFADLEPVSPSNPRSFTQVGDLLYFTTSSFEGHRLWRTDGTPEGTRRVDLPPEAPAEIRSLTAVGERLLFTSFQEPLGLLFRRELWSTDGTSEGTVRLVDVHSRYRLELPRVVVGRELFFLVELGPTQIWRTDGTPGGTVPWRFLPPDRSPVALHEVDGLLAIESEGPHGSELWWSADNLSPAERVGAFGFVGELTRVGDRVLFRGRTPELGAELWAFETSDFGIHPPPAQPGGVPEAPDRLEVFPTGNPGPLRVVWRDRSTNETSFVLQASNPVQPELETVAVLPADTTAVELLLALELPWTFRVRAENSDGVSAWSAEASAKPHFGLGTCDLLFSLCLLEGRFQVQVHWRDPSSGDFGIGHPSSFDFSDDSGTFWFFDPANVELVVKVLDARTVNGFHWAFYGALSNVEYWVTVTDLLEGTSRTYHNPTGNLCGSGDTRAFPRPGPPPLASPDEPVPLVVVETPEPIPAAVTSPAIAAGGTGGDAADCTDSDTALCLTGNRFRVEVEWRDPRSGDTGAGFAIPGTADSGFFWFFDPENVELVVKVLDARTVNGHFWVFYGGLSDVEYTITVTDTVEDVARQYRNEPLGICGQADTAAF